MSKVKLGVRARDRITGFEGMVIARTEYLYGCARWALQPQKVNKDGTIFEPQWFDDPQVEALSEVKEKPDQSTGGPKDAPKRNPDPGERVN